MLYYNHQREMIPEIKFYSQLKDTAQTRKDKKMTRTELVKKIYDDISSSWNFLEKDDIGYIVNWNGVWVRCEEADDAEAKCDEEIGSFEDHDAEYLALFESELNDDAIWEKKAEELADKWIAERGLDA